MPGVVEITNMDLSNRDQTEEKVKKIKRKSKTTCLTEASQDQIKVAVEIGEYRYEYRCTRVDILDAFYFCNGVRFAFSVSSVIKQYF